MKNTLFLLSALCLFGGVLAEQCFFNNTMLATYYNGTNLPNNALYGEILATQFTTVDKNFGTTSFYGGRSTLYSASFEGYSYMPGTRGYIQWSLATDDGFRLYINDVLFCSNWTIRSGAIFACPGQTFHAQGEKIKIRIEWFQNLVNQILSLRWNFGLGAAVMSPSYYWYENCTVYNIVGNSSATLDTGAGSTQLKYSLSGPPNGTVAVDIKSDCLYQSACRIYFDENNYKTFQGVNFFPDPHAGDTCCNVTATATSDDYFNNKTFVSRICKTSSNTTTGVSWGDPHYDTFDGQVHTFLSLGDFWILRQNTGDFVIQTRQVTCSTASCNGHLAIKYKTFILYLDIDVVTGVPQATFVGDNAGASVTIVGSTYTFTAPTGAKAKVLVGYWSTRHVYFLDVYVSLPNFYKGTVYGLLGFFDGIKTNDYTGANGVVYGGSQVATFQESWRIAAAEDLFLDSAAYIGPIFGAQASNTTIVSCGNNPTPPGDITPNNTNNTTPPTQNQTVPFSNVTFDCFNFTNATLQTAAINACAPYFNNTCCSSLGINGTSYYMNCLCDFNVVQSDELVSSAVTAYTGACAAAQTAANVSCATCPNGCSGHGTCNNGVCNCSTGWNGTDCSTDLTKCTNVSSITPASGGRLCANTITVYGQNFREATVYCIFSSAAQNLTVPATKYSDFQVTCTVPTTLSNTATVYVYSNGSCFQSVATYTLAPFCCDGPSKSAMTWGDPHIDSFDGMVYTFLDTGDYYFIRQASGDFVVQTSQTTCAAASCNGAVAIKFMSLIFYVTLTGTTDGIPIAYTTANVNLFGCSITSVNSRKLIFTAPTGAKVTIQSMNWVTQGLWFLNIGVTLPASYHNSIFGLGGYLDGNATNDFVDASGIVRPVSSVLTFARSWAVPTAENLFLNPAAVIPPIFGGSSPLTVAPSSCSNITNSSVPTSPVPPAHNVTNTTNNFDCRNFTNATLEAQAKADCSYFNNSCCGSVGVNGTAYYLDCLCDYNVAQGNSLINAAIDAYAESCLVKALAAGVSCTPPTPPPTEPPTIPPTVPPTQPGCATVSSVSPPSIGLYCNQTVTVYGTNFLSATLQCSFGGTIVPAVKISDTEATCNAPTVLLNSVTVSIISGAQCSSSSVNLTLTNECCTHSVSTSITWGDPHVNTIDGNFYTTLVPPGNYYFLRQTNGDLVIQTVQTPCYVAYCNSAAAIRFLDVSFYVNFSTIDGTAHFYTVGNPAAAGITVEMAASKFIIILPTKVTIVCQVLPWASLGIWYLNVAATLPASYLTYIYGIGGYFDGNPANDFTGLNGTVFGTTTNALNAFSLTWLVPPTEDLWLNNNAVIPPIFNGGSASHIAPLNCLAPSSAPTAPPPYCPAITDGEGTWQRGALGQTHVYGVCNVGFVGTPVRPCFANSTYGPVSVSCVPDSNSCGANQYGNAFWPGSPVDTMVTGTCVPGYTGTPTRKCLLDSTWSSALNTYCSRVQCAFRTEAGASWATSYIGTVYGTCTGGTTGVIYRNCTIDGSWGAIVGSCSAPVGCGTETYGNAVWQTTAVGATATGVCNPGYNGTPTRKCNLNSVWSSNISPTCQRNKCPAGTFNGATYAETAGNSLANGVCVGATTGAPQRFCDTLGNWGNFRGTACV